METTFHPLIKTLSAKTTDEIIFDLTEEIYLQDNEFINAPGFAAEILDDIKESGDDDWFNVPYANIVSIALESYRSRKENLKGEGTFGLTIGNDKSKDTGTKKIGAPYKGVKHIKKIENDIFYCPSDNYCLFKCYEKFLFLEKGIKYKFDRVGINPYYNTKYAYDAVIVNSLCPKNEKESDEDYKIRKTKFLYTFPQINFIKLDENRNIVLTPNNTKHLVSNCPNYKIGLIRVDKNTYHSILLKFPYTTSTMLEENMFKFELKNSLKLVNDWSKLEQIKIKDKQDYIIVYDIETSIYTKNVMIAKILKEKKIFVPFALSYQLISLYNNKPIGEPIEVICSYDKLKENETDLFDKLFESIEGNFSDLMDNIKEIQVFAHNGGKFDNVFLKSAKNVKFIRQIKDGSNIKMISCSYNERPNLTYIFKDTLPFCLSSLKNIAKLLKCSDKMEFDIKNWSRQKYIDNINSTDEKTNWRKYMCQDVITLSEVVLKLEKVFNSLSTSMTINLGLPGVAWDLMMKNCFTMSNNIYIPKDPSMKEFCRSSYYGGRVICNKRYFSSKSESSIKKLTKSINNLTKGGLIEKEAKDFLICLDANSLYPSAMALGNFPVGIPNLLDNNIKNKINFETMKNSLNKNRNFKSSLPVITHYILEIVFKIPNIKNTLVPYRTEEGYIIYPSNGVYQGVYNDVDITEMLKDGYTILEVKNGIYWSKSERIFTYLIEDLYERRQYFKSIDSYFEYILKILLNSMYGKLSETIDVYSYFTNDELIDLKSRATNLFNGQKEIVERHTNKIVKKPVYLASYITSYSRSIMNEYIRKIGMENIWYGDTDSLYVLKSAFEKSGIKISKELGGVKNDYGDDVYITEAYFLDIKRYFLQKEVLNPKKIKITVDSKEIEEMEDKYPISCKYAGLCFKDQFSNVSVSNVGLLVWNNEQKEKIKSIYKNIVDEYDGLIIDKDFGIEDSARKMEIIIEKWIRNNMDVCIVNTEMCYYINPEKKYQIRSSEKYGKEYFSLGFNEFEKEYKLFNDECISVKEWGQYYKVVVGKLIFEKETNTTIVKQSLPFTNSKLTKPLYNKDVNMVLFNKHNNVKLDYFIWPQDKNIFKIINRREKKVLLNKEEKNDLLNYIKENNIQPIKKLDYVDFYQIDRERYKFKQIGKTNKLEIYRIDEEFFHTYTYGAFSRLYLNDKDKEKLYPLIGNPENGFCIKNTEELFFKESEKTLINSLSKLINKMSE